MKIYHFFYLVYGANLSDSPQHSWTNSSQKLTNGYRCGNWKTSCRHKAVPVGVTRRKGQQQVSTPVRMGSSSCQVVQGTSGTSCIVLHCYVVLPIIHVYISWWTYILVYFNYCVGWAVQNVLSCTSECLFGGINHYKNWTTVALL